MPGVAQVLTSTLLASLQKLSALTNNQIAASWAWPHWIVIAGHFERDVWVGRTQVRAILYMGVIVAARFNPVIRVIY